MRATAIVAAGKAHAGEPSMVRVNLTGTTPRVALKTLDPSALMGCCTWAPYTGRVAVGVVVVVGVSVDVAVSVAVVLGVEVAVGVAVALAVGVDVAVAVSVAVLVAVGVGVSLGVGVLVAVGVSVAVALGVLLGLGVSLGVGAGGAGPNFWIRLLPSSTTYTFSAISTATPVVKENSPLPTPGVPHFVRKVPVLLNCCTRRLNSSAT